MIYKLAQGKTLDDLAKRKFIYCPADDYFVMWNSANDKSSDDLVGVVSDTKTNDYGIIASRDDSPTIESLLKLGIIEPKR